jgi:hypothetical protein
MSDVSGPVSKIGIETALLANLSCANVATLESFLRHPPSKIAFSAAC